MRDKRLFVAIDLPEVITRLLVELNPNLPGIRWLSAEQIHLTISFLGNVSLPAEAALGERLGAIRFKPFFMPVAGLGTFPAKGKPTVIWAGLGTGHPQLFHLNKRIQEAALAAGLEPDLRTWHPHITFARPRDVARQAVLPFLKEHREFDAGLVRVESFALYSSRPGPLGSVYSRELEVRAT